MIKVEDRKTFIQVEGTKTTVVVGQPQIQVISVGIQGPPGPAGESGAAAPTRKVIPIGQEEVVERFPWHHRSRAWAVDIWEKGAVEPLMSYQVSVKLSDTDAVYSKYAILGTRIQHDSFFDFDLQGNSNNIGLVDWKVRNRHTADLEIQVRKIV